MVDSRCGLHCTGCGWKTSHGCKGCIETLGNPFHGECPVAICCQKKGHRHCGECQDIPCQLLTDYSCHPEHGDSPHGARIEQCNQWFLSEIIARFADSGWDLIAIPSKEWLSLQNEKNTTELIVAIKEAFRVCGKCGCEYDLLYEKALERLKNLSKIKQN